MTRVIIHLDLDAFYCSVESQRYPELRDKAFAVGGAAEGRGVVASASYPARAAGVRSAMPMAQAHRLCPGLIVVPPDFAAYRAASDQVMDYLRSITPLLEQLSIDEAFLDVTDHPHAGAALAPELQRTIRATLNLSCSLGVASNKLVAKIATDVGKAAARNGKLPQALLVVAPGDEATFLAPLPVSSLWGVGPKTEAALAALGIRTIGALAEWPVADLIRRFGQHGEEMALRAVGIDDRSVVTERVAKSISQETTFPHDILDRATLQKVMRQQAATVARKLQAQNLRGTTVKIKLRWPDFTTLTRQVTLPRATDDAEAIAAAALRLLALARPEGQPVRLIGVGVSGLGELPQQLSLWDTVELQQD